MKKIILILSLIASCFLLSGCMQARLEYGIDEKNAAYAKIDFEVDATELEELDKNNLNKALKRLISYYDGVGYSVESDIMYTDENKAYFTALLERPCNSREEAFTQLKAILTDDKFTPFTELYADSQDGILKNSYSISGTLNAEKVLALSGLENFPIGFKEYAQQSIEKSEFTIALRLPSSEVLSHTGSLTEEKGFATQETKISFTEPTSITLSTLSLDPYGRLFTKEEAAQFDKISAIAKIASIVVICSAIPLTVLCFILRARKFKVCTRPSLPLRKGVNRRFALPGLADKANRDCVQQHNEHERL